MYAKFTAASIIVFARAGQERLVNGTVISSAIYLFDGSNSREISLKVIFLRRSPPPPSSIWLFTTGFFITQAVTAVGDDGDNRVMSR